MGEYVNFYIWILMMSELTSLSHGGTSTSEMTGTHETTESALTNTSSYPTIENETHLISLEMMSTENSVPTTSPNTDTSALSTTYTPNTDVSELTTTLETDPSAPTTISTQGTDTSALTTTYTPNTDVSELITTTVETDASALTTTSTPNTDASALTTTYTPNTDASALTTTYTPNTDVSELTTTVETDASARTTTSTPNTDASVETTTTLDTEASTITAPTLPDTTMSTVNTTSSTITASAITKTTTASAITATPPTTTASSIIATPTTTTASEITERTATTTASAITATPTATTARATPPTTTASAIIATPTTTTASKITERTATTTASAITATPTTTTASAITATSTASAINSTTSLSTTSVANTPTTPAIKECQNGTCQNNGACYNLANSFICICKTGWEGPRCENDTNECDKYKPCAIYAVCTNSPGSFTCKCTDGYSGNGSVKCTQNVLFSIPTGGFKYTGDDTFYGAYYIPGGMDYFGQTYYYAYVYMNGYITLGQSFNSRYPLAADSWRYYRVPIIAPLWTDIETKSINGEPESGLYINILWNGDNQSEIQRVINSSDFRPRYSLMVTWKNAVPYPHLLNSKYEITDCQAIISTNGSYTYVIFNYDQTKFTWTTGGKNLVIGYSKSYFDAQINFNGTTFTQVNEKSNTGVNGRWLYSVSLDTDPVRRARALCYEWYLDTNVQSMLYYARILSDPCPCSLSQATRDWRFSWYNYFNGIAFYKTIWSQWPYSHYQKCHYQYHYYNNYWWWWWWSSADGFLLQGYPNGGYLDSHDSRLKISDAFSNCCQKGSGLCQLFYERNPSRSCRGYSPPFWRPTWGDPHMTTFDGVQYTFNGRGEYTLLQLLNRLLTVQVRTDIVNENDTDATVFVGIAARDNVTSDIVELVLHRATNTSNIYVNGILNTTFSSSSPSSVFIETNGISIFNESNKIVMSFQSGLSLQVTIHNILDIVTAAPDDDGFRGQTRGLLGDYNGNPSDDFIMRNGSILPANSTESLLFQFGQSWMIDKNESLFNYSNVNGTYEFFNNMSFKPHHFIKDIAENKTAFEEYIKIHCAQQNITASAVMEACGNNTACKIDAAATCNPAFGKASMELEQNVEKGNEILENFPPNITAPDILYVGFRFNATLTLNMSAYVSDDNLNNITINSSIEGSNYTFKDNIFVWNVSEHFRNSNKTVFVKFFADDTMNAITEYWPNIYYCGCNKSAECDYSTALVDSDNDDHFFRAHCNCSEDTQGDNCELERDICDPTPCYSNVNCSRDRPDNPCGPCPSGLSGNGTRCFDINECNAEEAVCGQFCENTEGSFYCQCRTGYEIAENRRDCNDVDECGDRVANNCSEVQICINTDGSFQCKCKPGYSLVEDNCQKVESSFVGTLNFGTFESNDDVVKAAVTRMLKDIFDVGNSSYVSTEVIIIFPVQNTRTSTTPILQFNCQFVVSSNKTVSTNEVGDKFNTSIRSKIRDSLYMWNTIALIINASRSRMYADDEYSICNVTNRVQCDPVSTNCASENGTQTCTCKNGFKGFIDYTRCKDIDECDNTTLEDYCKNGEACNNLHGSYLCRCKPGHVLFNSSQCIDMCTSSPCQNGGTCFHGEQEGQYQCRCTSNWIGTNCEEQSSFVAIIIAVGCSAALVFVFLVMVIVKCVLKRNKNTLQASEKRLLVNKPPESILIPRPRVRPFKRAQRSFHMEN